MEQGGNCKGCEKWLDFEYISYIGMAASAKELEVGSNKRGFMGDPKVFGSNKQTNWMIGPWRQWLVVCGLSFALGRLEMVI